MNDTQEIKDKLKLKKELVIATIIDPVTKRKLKFNIINEHTLWRAKSIYTKELITIKWIRSFQKNKIFFDIGANIGLYSIFAAINNSSKVFSFEPESNNFQILMHNLIINNLTKYITPYQIGLSDKTEFTKLNLNKFEAGLSHHTVGDEALSHSNLNPIKSRFTQGIFSTTLDELCFKWKIEFPSYIKIDVDGIEHKIISESKKVLSSSILKSVLIEINQNRIEDKKIINTMKDFKFNFDKDQVNESTRKTGPHEGYAEYLFYK